MLMEMFFVWHSRMQLSPRKRLPTAPQNHVTATGTEIEIHVVKVVVMFVKAAPVPAPAPEKEKDLEIVTEIETETAAGSEEVVIGAVLLAVAAEAETEIGEEPGVELIDGNEVENAVVLGHLHHRHHHHPLLRTLPNPDLGHGHAQDGEGKASFHGFTQVTSYV